jgi:hypothetical protein
MKNFKAFKHQDFSCTLENGDNITLSCYTTNTRNGFTHQCFSSDFPEVTKSRICYCGRTWEAFEYETVLRSFISKLPMSMQSEIIAKVVDKTAEEEHEKTTKQVETFANTFNALSDDSKNRMRRIFADGINTPEQAEIAQQAANMFAAFDMFK